MKITQDIRDYVAAGDAGDALTADAGMAQMAERFKEQGGEIYIETPSGE